MNMPAVLRSALPFICIVAVTACKSSSEADRESAATRVALPADSLDAALDSLEPRLTVTPRGDGSYYFGFSVASGPATPRVNSVTFDIHAPDGRLFDTRTTREISTSGPMAPPGERAPLLASAGVEWRPAGPLPEGSYVIMTARSNRGIVARRAGLPMAEAPATAKPLALTLDSRPRGRETEFILRVERLAPGPAGEYLPSSEKFRIELTNDVGETIWQSSRGMAFAQAIGPVEPLNVGEVVEYRATWDGTSQLTREPMLPGSYRVIATIPAKPKPYVLREEFTWSGR